LPGPDPVRADFIVISPTVIRVWVDFSSELLALPATGPNWIASYNGFQYDSTAVFWGNPAHTKLRFSMLKSFVLPFAKTVSYRGFVLDLANLAGGLASPFFDYPMFGP